MNGHFVASKTNAKVPGEMFWRDGLQIFGQFLLRVIHRCKKVSKGILPILRNQYSIIRPPVTVMVPAKCWQPARCASRSLTDKASRKTLSRFLAGNADAPRNIFARASRKSASNCSLFGPCFQVRSRERDRVLAVYCHFTRYTISPGRSPRARDAALHHWAVRSDRPPAGRSARSLCWKPLLQPSHQGESL